MFTHAFIFICTRNILTKTDLYIFICNRYILLRNSKSQTFIFIIHTKYFGENKFITLKGIVEQ